LKIIGTILISFAAGAAILADRFFNSRQKFCEVFSQNRFTRAFSLLFATAPTTTATAATRSLKLNKLSFRSCKRLREMVYYQ